MMITFDRLREVLSYDPKSGIFRWLLNSNGASAVGNIAGSVGKWGHRRIAIDRKRYMAHRLAWFYMTGEWPKDQVDHRNVQPDDNRWVNLREATGSQNGANTKARRLGLKGATFNKSAKRYQAQITVRGKPKYLGLFPTENEAHAAYMAAARGAFGEYARAE